MSTILTTALSKKDGDPAPAADPGSILERNATYRDALRRRGRDRAERRRTALMAGSLTVAMAVLLIGIPVWINSSGSNDGGPNGRQLAAAAVIPAVETIATPAPSPEPTPEPTPARTSVRLRPRPLLRSDISIDTPPEEPRTVYIVATPGPITPMPPPVETPERVVRRRVDPTPSPTPDDPRYFLDLTGALQVSDRPAALINGEIVDIGETIDGARLLSIDKGPSIRVEYKGKEYKISLN